MIQIMFCIKLLLLSQNNYIIWVIHVNVNSMLRLNFAVCIVWKNINNWYLAQDNNIDSVL